MTSALERSTFEGTDPNLLYRVVKSDAVDDFYKTGLIRGSNDFLHEAYFLKGGLWDSYNMPNMRISLNPTVFNAETNPLYSGWRPDMDGRVRVLMPKGAGVMSLEEMAAHEASIGSVGSFLDNINPANRAGLKIDNMITGQTFYDRITPFLDRPLSTHAANIGTEARIVGNAIRNNPGAATGTALGVAGAGLSVYDMYDRASEGAAAGEQDRQRSYESQADFPYTRAFFAETGARMPGYLEGVANFVTFGTYDELTGNPRALSNTFEEARRNAMESGAYHNTTGYSTFDKTGNVTKFQRTY